MALRVLHLVRALRVGGLENVVVGLVNGLAARGVENHVGCLVEAGDWLPRARAQGVWLGHLETRGRAAVVLSLRRYLRANRIEILHSHNSQAHIFGVAAAALARVPLVHTKHGQNWPDNPRWVWLSRQMSRLTRTIIPVSADIERIVTRIEKVPARKVVKIVNGIDTEAFGAGDGSQESGVRARLGIEPEAFVVGSVGRLAWEKNYELLVGAFAALSQRAPGSRLILVGEGPYRERIAQAARAAGVFARCVLPGLQENVAPWLGALDVFCLSSLTEGTSVTLLEAGASGLPAVVTDVGGNAEIVQHGVTGLVVPSGDREALAGALLELQADLERRRRMGAAARRRVQECYSLERMVRAYLAVYESVSRDEGGAGEGS